MRLFKKVAIVGTGLIGGSIALCIKKKGLAGMVVGVSRHKKSLLLAKRKGAIDSGSQKLDIIQGADLLILATPVNIIIDLAPKIARIIGKECLVTDVGSTKEEISLRLSRIFPNYIGSHPLAGSEKRSVINAQASLFKDSICIITVSGSAKQKALNKLKIFWRALGARVVLLTPQSHDRILSFVSHLPHIAAFSLINSAPGEHLKFAATGLKDTTRIAASDPGLWTDIFLSNRKNLIKAISLLQENLSKIKSAIAKKDKAQLIRILSQAKKKRDRLG